MSKTAVAAGAAVALALLAGCTTTTPGNPTTSPQPVTVTATATVQPTPSPSTVTQPPTTQQPPVTVTQPPVTVTQQPPSTQAATFDFPFPVTQGSSSDEWSIVSVILNPANNSDWGPNNNATLHPIYAECETNTESAAQNSYQYNCNIAFSDYPDSSYWVSFTTDHSNFVAVKRTY